MIRHVSLESSARHSTAFTLLELILAVGLTSLLMAAVYAAMSTYWNLAMDSHEEIERTRIAQAILQQLARDIQSCTFAEATEQSFDDTSDQGSPTGSGAGEAATTPSRNGLVGTDRDLILYISRPDRELNYVAAPDAVGTTDRNSDLLIVRWLLADSAGGSLAAAVADQHASDSDGITAGLARGSGGVTGFGQAIDTSNIGLQLESTELIASEVKSVLFEYFDGVDWVAEWDTGTVNRMPQAVRIELTLRKAPDGDSSTPDPRDLPETRHTLVVPVLISSPYLEETAI